MSFINRIERMIRIEKDEGKLMFKEIEWKTISWLIRLILKCNDIAKN
jgi:hypothetical protein